MTMGEKILNMRKARGWSQEELADQVGVTRQAVSRWESGSAKPDADKIVAICDLFGVSADYLLREQYGGEQVHSVSTQDSNEREKKRTSLTIVQIFGILMVVLGSLMLFVLVIMSVIKPHEVHHLADDSYRIYTGFLGFLMGNQLEWLAWLDGILTVAGVLLIFSENVRKICKQFGNMKWLQPVVKWGREYRGLPLEEE